MRTLIVTAHPDHDSLTSGVARELRDAVGAGDVELADLAAEAFDPRFGPADRRTYRGEEGVPADVAREQQRIAAADHLVLVFPVYWWSMPALLKGWIDRVFVKGWAFGADADGVPRDLAALTVHLLPVAGDTADSYERRGYERALRTQVEHGIVDYCGAQRGVTAFIHESERADDEGRRAAVMGALEEVARAIRREDAAQPSRPREDRDGGGLGTTGDSSRR